MGRKVMDGATAYMADSDRKARHRSRETFLELPTGTELDNLYLTRNCITSVNKIKQSL